MQSAFGVEHGDEFAKFGMPTALVKPFTGAGNAVARKTTQMGGKLKPLSSAKLGGSIGRPTAKPVKPTGMAGAKQGLGSGLRRAGGAMAAHPTATGVGVAGAGAAGGYGLSRRKQ